MSTALSLPTLPSSVTGPSHIPDLTESADIQTALKYLYYGSGGTLNSANGIYGALAGLKTYVDASISGVNVHENVKAATLVGIPIPGTYAAGTADASGGTGVGAKITYTATGVVTIDGVTLALNDRILVKDGTTALSGINSIANGIYYISTLGASGVACVLTRTTDGDNSVQGECAEGDFVFISGGTTPNNNTSWILTSSSATGTGPAGAIKIGTDPITYIQFGAVTWGSQTANTFFAAPNGSAGTPTFRGIQLADMSASGSPTIYGQALTYAPVGNGMAWAGPYVSTGSAITLPAGTTSTAPLKFTTTSAALLTTPVAAAMEYDSSGFYTTLNTTVGRGLLDSSMYSVNTAGTSLGSVGASATTTFSIFGTNGVSLEAGTVYRIEASLIVSVTGATSGGTYGAIASLGSATTAVTTQNYDLMAGTTNSTTLAAAGTALTPTHYAGTTLSPSFTLIPTTAVSTAATTFGRLKLSGTIVTNVAGPLTLRLSVTTTAPSTVTSVIPQKGSYIRITPVGPVGMPQVGNWA